MFYSLFFLLFILTKKTGILRHHKSNFDYIFRDDVFVFTKNCVVMAG